jgi:predicted metal-dependent hydrolase
MENATTEYDPRYLAGILFFNEADFFEAHEVWEDIWQNTPGPERKFFQGLIQAAVALYHFGNGNLRGALKLFHSSRGYLQTFGPSYLGLDLQDFAAQMDRCFAEVLAHENEPDRSLRPADELRPQISLNPPPDHWPDPAEYVTPEE